MVSFVKRDCTEVEFNKDKIENAILAAMKYGVGTVKPKIAKDIANEIFEECKDRDEVTTAEVEAMVYDKLITKKQRLVARAYEGYRSIREFQRETENTIDNDINSLLGGTNEELNTENSNKDQKLLTTMRDYMAGIVSKDLIRRTYPPKIIQAHEEGILHLHDQDYISMRITNCCLINLKDMLENGTIMNGKTVDPQKRFITACTVATQIIAAVTSSQYGGATITLTHLAPFVRKSYERYYKKYLDRGLGEEQAEKFAWEDTKEEIRDGVQTFNYQINTLMTTNG